MSAKGAAGPRAAPRPAAARSVPANQVPVVERVDRAGRVADHGTDRLDWTPPDKRLVLITGSVGLGKTFLCKALGRDPLWFCVDFDSFYAFWLVNVRDPKAAADSPAMRKSLVETFIEVVRGVGPPNICVAATNFADMPVLFDAIYAIRADDLEALYRRFLLRELNTSCSSRGNLELIYKKFPVADIPATVRQIINVSRLDTPYEDFAAMYRAGLKYAEAIRASILPQDKILLELLLLAKQPLRKRRLSATPPPTPGAKSKKKP